MVVLDINHKAQGRLQVDQQSISLPDPPHESSDQAPPPLPTLASSTPKIIPVITTTTTNTTTRPAYLATQRSTTRPKELHNPMDSALIHLLPNLFPSSFHNHPRHPSTTSPAPPPPYALHPPTNPSPKTNIPLTISLLGSLGPTSNKRPLLYCLQDHLSLSPETSYEEFIGILQIELARLGVSGNASENEASWKVGISATGRRSTRVFGRRVLWGGSEVEVRGESWESVRLGFGEGGSVGLKAVCWRE